MRKVLLNSSAFLASKDDKKFILLGSETATNPDVVENSILPKIRQKNSKPVPGIWGTLGFSNDKKINWRGHLEISSNGNDSFKGAVKEEIELLQECFPQLRDPSNQVKERFISFEHVDFPIEEPFTLENIPKLRLDLMLSPEEGAIVFYQHDKKNDENTVIEYLQPKPTKENKVHNRDRLRYDFPIIPSYDWVEMDEAPGFYMLSTQKKENPFIIKIITFQRTFDKKETLEKDTDSKAIIAKVEEVLDRQIHEKGLHKPHKLVYFNRENNLFHEAEINTIDPDKKTLFLMHGTFGSTYDSFHKVYGDDGQWLKNITDPALTGHYEQVVGFDHPSVFYGAKENIDELFLCMSKLGIQTFKNRVDFIGTSQGGLLVQYLANLEQTRVQVGKVVLVASANGVGYLKSAQKVPKFLTVLKYFFKSTGQKPQALICAIAQHSAEFFLEQPGMQVMTPGSENLKVIMNNTPYNSETRYLPIIDDFDKSIVQSKHGKIIRYFKKLGAQGIDLVARSMLGKYNDWVVGSKEQYIVPTNYCAIPNYNPAKFQNEMVQAIHGTAIAKKDVQKNIQNFFMSDKVIDDSKIEAADRFDAHCHIFGREIISARILALLIDELREYKNKKPDEKNLLPKPLLNKHPFDNKKPEGTIFTVAKNIIKYFVLNKNSFEVLDDLQNEYHKVQAQIYRYIPLMFDLEMTFRNKYNKKPDAELITENDKSFKSLLKEFLTDIDKHIDRFEKNKMLVFDASPVENEDAIKYLKVLKRVISGLKILNINSNKDTISGYKRQLHELVDLKKRYGSGIYPFLAVDPRRKNMGSLIKKYVGSDKPFYGIKLYAPNGYSPTDWNLYNNKSNFIDEMCLYSYCIKNKIPIMAHCSDAGFATFTKDLEVYGHIYVDGKLIDYSEKPTNITFSTPVNLGNFKQAVRERAQTLNHPLLWEKVLEKHEGLRLCLAHFGGASKDWRQKIAELMESHDSVFTDLSCMTEEQQLKEVKKNYFGNKKIVDRIMYGSDFYLSMLQKLSFSDYYTHFRSTFSQSEMLNMTLHAPTKYLEPDIT